MIEVTTRDTETGESQTATIANDYALIVAGACYVAHIQDFPRAGTRIITIKGRGGRGHRPEAAPAGAAVEPTLPPGAAR